MLFLTGLNHYWTLRVPQSSYISSLKFLQLGVKRLPFWCNASLTEDKSASIRRLSTVKHEPKGWGSHIHSSTGHNFPQATRSWHCERCSVRCDSSLLNYTSSNCWSCTKIKRKNIKIFHHELHSCTGMIAHEYMTCLPWCKMESPYVHAQFKSPETSLFNLEIRPLCFVTILQSSHRETKTILSLWIEFCRSVLLVNDAGVCNDCAVRPR